MDKHIQIYKDLAQERDKVKKHFLKERKQKILKDALGVAQAQPIVEPIVRAIEKAKPTTDNALMTVREVSEHVHTIVEIDISNLNRKQFLNRIRELYQNERLFNVLLAMVRLRHITQFPIKKVTSIGPIDSLIFYGQGGNNLDFVMGIRQTPKFKMRLNEFNIFYKNHEKMIDDVFHKITQDINREYEDSEIGDYVDDNSSTPPEPETETDPGLDDGSESDGDDMPVGYVADEAVETISTGSGLKNRLGVLHASRVAGNTSLDIVNEAHDILKMLLKNKKISKDEYLQVKNLFE